MPPCLEGSASSSLAAHLQNPHSGPFGHFSAPSLKPEGRGSESPGTQVAKLECHSEMYLQPLLFTDDETRVTVPLANIYSLCQAEDTKDGEKNGP